MAALIPGSFNVNTIMQSVKAYLTHLQTQATDDIRIHQHLASFQEATQKINYLESLESADERADQQQCTTISAAIKDLPTSGGLMLMTGDTKGAARSAHEASSWHCICVLRHQSTLWVFDPAFDPETMPSKQRIDQITELAMLKHATSI